MSQPTPDPTSQDGPRYPRRTRRELREAKDPKGNVWTRMPRYRRALLIFLTLGVIAATFWVELATWFHGVLPKTASIRLVDEDGKTVALAGRADVFLLDRTQYLRSPQPALGTLELDGAGEVLIMDSSRFPKSLQVRFHVPGYGVDYASVELGRRREYKLRLGAPAEVHGVVLDRVGQPLAGARVLALGTHQRGVVVAEAESDQAGKFVLGGISKRVGSLVLRVLKDGFAMVEREHLLEEYAADRVRDTTFRLTPVPPVVGKLQLPSGTNIDGLTVGVLRVPGVWAKVDREGQFRLHHLAANTRYRLLVRGLPEGLSHEPVYAGPGARVTIDVLKVMSVRGRVVSRRSGQGVANARISNPCSPEGTEVVLSDKMGGFQLRFCPLRDHLVTVELPTTFSGGGTEEHVLAVDDAGEVTITVR